MKSIHVQEVCTPEDREAVFRLRYQVYVQERGCPQKYADHERQRIEEPLDPPPPANSSEPAGRRQGVILGAFDGAELVGTVRYNWCDTHAGEYADYYQLDQFGLRPEHRATLTTKLCVRPGKRGTGILAQLAIYIYAHGLINGCKINFIDCNPPLRKLFLKMGFRQVVPDFDHPEYGTVHPMLLLLHDYDHLLAMSSPFLELKSLINPLCPSVEYFKNAIRERACNLKKNEEEMRI